MVPENKQNRRYKKLTLLAFKIIFTRHTLLDCRHMAAIQERVTAVLRSIPKEAFVDTLQTLYERCQQCGVKDGDYLEGQ
jgi:hypothetical protein